MALSNSFVPLKRATQAVLLVFAMLAVLLSAAPQGASAAPQAAAPLAAAPQAAAPQAVAPLAAAPQAAAGPQAVAPQAAAPQAAPQKTQAYYYYCYYWVYPDKVVFYCYLVDTYLRLVVTCTNGVTYYTPWAGPNGWWWLWVTCPYPYKVSSWYYQYV